jgi:DNA polymerase-3 subunit gamma/tau
MPETVKSRCQRFDFRRISDQDIVEWLSDICDQEGLNVPQEGLAAIARSARGGMRDALGALDQLAAYGDEHELEDVLPVLGAVDGRLLGQVVDAVADADVAAALRLVNESLSAGTDVEDFADQLSQYLRDMLVAGYCGADDPMLAGSTADGQKLAEQAKRFTADQITYMIQVLREAKLRARRDTTGRLALELAIVKLGRLADLVPLEDLAEAVAGGAASGGSVGPGGPTHARGGASGGSRSGGSSGGSNASSRISSMRERLKNGRKNGRSGRGPRARAGGNTEAGGNTGPRTATSTAPPAKEPAAGNTKTRPAEKKNEVPEPEGEPDTPAAEPATTGDPVELDEMAIRQIVNAADDPMAAREAMRLAPLRRAFAQAQKALGVEPVKMQFPKDEPEDEEEFDAEEALAEGEFVEDDLGEEEFDESEFGDDDELDQ